MGLYTVEEKDKRKAGCDQVLLAVIESHASQVMLLIVVVAPNCDCCLHHESVLPRN